MQTATTLTAPSPESETNIHAQLTIECARGGSLQIPCNEGITFASASLDDAIDLLATAIEALPHYDLSSSPLSGTIHTALSRIREAGSAIQQIDAINQSKK